MTNRTVLRPDGASIVGVGGVVISADTRGTRLGSELMSWAAQSMRDRGRAR